MAAAKGHVPAPIVTSPKRGAYGPARPASTVAKGDQEPSMLRRKEKEADASEDAPA